MIVNSINRINRITYNLKDRVLCTWVSILYRKINPNSNSNTPTLPYPNQPKIPSQKESANKISADKLQINLVSF